MTPDPSFKTGQADQHAEQANEQKKPGENPGREVPRGQETDDNSTNATATDKASAATPLRTPRTGLRREEEHASRHDVRKACHCGPEGHQ